MTLGTTKPVRGATAGPLDEDVPPQLAARNAAVARIPPRVHPVRPLRERDLEFKVADTATG
jgi:hypothetical protein